MDEEVKRAIEELRPYLRGLYMGSEARIAYEGADPMRNLGYRNWEDYGDGSMCNMYTTLGDVRDEVAGPLVRLLKALGAVDEVIEVEDLVGDSD